MSAFTESVVKDAAIDLLLALNVAKTLHDPSPLKSVGLHKLKGDAYGVEIVDYHRG